MIGFVLPRENARNLVLWNAAAAIFHDHALE
jgi:hypothetical protein